MIDTNLETNMLSIVRVNEPGRKKITCLQLCTNKYLPVFLRLAVQKLLGDDTNLYQANQTSHHNLTQGAKLHAKVRCLELILQMNYW